MQALASSLCTKVMYAEAEVSCDKPLRPLEPESPPPVLWLRFTTTLAMRPYCPKKSARRSTYGLREEFQNGREGKLDQALVRT